MNFTVFPVTLTGGHGHIFLTRRRQSAKWLSTLPFTLPESNGIWIAVPHVFRSRITDSGELGTWLL